MTNVQAVTTPRKPAAKQRMYRGILTAQAICDVFVRTTSDEQANRLFEAGKGQRKKPRFGEWQLWQEAIAVDTYRGVEDSCAGSSKARIEGAGVATDL